MCHLKCEKKLVCLVQKKIHNCIFSFHTFRECVSILDHSVQSNLHLFYICFEGNTFAIKNSHLPSILSMFFLSIFRMKVLQAAFLQILFGKKALSYKKGAQKMLMKLTPGVVNCLHLRFGSNLQPSESMHSVSFFFSGM